jgi:hypothetical protein
MVTPSVTIVTMMTASTLSQRSRDHAGDEQDDDERIGEEVEELNEGRQTLDGSRLVRTVARQAFGRFAAAQSWLGHRLNGTPLYSELTEMMIGVQVRPSQPR